jgi:hypothetical protein
MHHPELGVEIIDGTVNGAMLCEHDRTENETMMFEAGSCSVRPDTMISLHGGQHSEIAAAKAGPSIADPGISMSVITALMGGAPPIS